MDRRTFLVCAAARRGWWRAPALVADAAAQEAYARLDRAEKMRLAEMAMLLARRAGATYADLRISRTLSERLFVRDENLQSIAANAEVGFGLRMLINGAWGFVASPLVTEAEIRRLAPNCGDLARANRRLQERESCSRACRRSKRRGRCRCRPTRVRSPPTTKPSC